MTTTSFTIEVPLGIRPALRALTFLHNQGKPAEEHISEEIYLQETALRLLRENASRLNLGEEYVPPTPMFLPDGTPNPDYFTQPVEE